MDCEVGIKRFVLFRKSDVVIRFGCETETCSILPVSRPVRANSSGSRFCGCIQTGYSQPQNQDGRTREDGHEQTRYYHISIGV